MGKTMIHYSWDIDWSQFSFLDTEHWMPTSFECTANTEQPPHITVAATGKSPNQALVNAWRKVRSALGLPNLE